MSSGLFVWERTALTITASVAPGHGICDLFLVVWGHVHGGWGYGPVVVVSALHYPARIVFCEPLCELHFDETHGMTQLRQSLEISATPAALFDYVSRPLRWKEWHHSSLEVRGVQDEPLVAGRRFEESVMAAGGLRRELTWLVEESHPGKRWRASAYMADGSTVRLCYEFDASAAGTHFTRSLDYTVAPVFLRLINHFFLQEKVKKESDAALQRLAAHFQSA